MSYSTSALYFHLLVQIFQFIELIQITTTEESFRVIAEELTRFWLTRDVAALFITLLFCFHIYNKPDWISHLIFVELN